MLSSRVPRHPAMRRPLALWFLLTLLLPAVTHAQSDDPGPVWDPGIHEVGFRQWWALDHGRNWSSEFDNGQTYGGTSSPRPVLINLWYPAEVAEDDERMLHCDYLAVSASGRPELRRLASMLSSHSRSVATKEVTGKDFTSLDPDESAALQHIFSRTTRCVRDAQPKARRWPVVLYHSGAGSTFDDNAMLCESLSQQGYVVVGSAFLQRDGRGLQPDGGAGSIDDVQFLLNEVASLPFVDSSRFAAIGHSLGGQVLLRAAARPDSAIDALVLLDTTVDYYTLHAPLFAELSNEILEHRDTFRTPILAAAGPDAAFQLLDRLTGADRFYFTIPALDHNQYISQGMQRLIWLDMMKAKDPTSAERDQRMGHYDRLHDIVRLFLDGHLYDQPSGLDVRQVQLNQDPFGSTTPWLEHTAAGVDGPPDFEVESDQIPTPRQLPRLIEAMSVARVVSLLEQAHARDPDHPVFTARMLYGSMLFDLVVDERIEEARQLHEFVMSIDLNALGSLAFQATMARLLGRTVDEVRIHKAIMAIDPEYGPSVERLKELDMLVSAGIGRPS